MANTLYATVDELQAVLESAPLTSTRAQEILNQVAAQVDAALTAAGYTAPATGANDLVLISQFVVYMAAAQAHRELYQEDEAPERITAWERQFERFLAGIAKGAIRLPDQATGDNAGGITVGRIRFRRGGGTTSEWG